MLTLVVAQYLFVLLLLWGLLVGRGVGLRVGEGALPPREHEAEQVRR